MAVDSQHEEYASAHPKWVKCRDASEGQDAVHAKGERYLKKLAEQSREEYDAYKERALYYNATGRTVEGMSGLVFRRPPTTEIPESIEYVNKDADAAGTPLLSFSEKVVDDLMQTGRIGLLTDYPHVEPARTKADELAVGARPYVKIYPAEAIINWNTDKVAGSWQLTLVVLEEQHKEAIDEFDSKCIKQWRVLRLVEGVYQVDIWRKSEKDEKPVKVESFTPMMSGSRSIPFIPFLICGPMGIDVKVAKSPIKDLVDVNISHYQSTADYEHGLHFTGLPTPVVYGHMFDEGEKFSIGSSVVKAFPNPEAKAEYMEFKGEGLKQISKRLEEKQEMMAALGARMLATEKRAVEAAETASIHRASENSVLASLANAVSSALSKAFTWCAMWVGSTDEAVVSLNTDYLPVGLSAQELTALVAAWQSGAISFETLFDNLQRGEIAKQGGTAEEEEARIRESAPNLSMNAGGNVNEE